MIHVEGNELDKVLCTVTAQEEKLIGLYVTDAAIPNYFKHKNEWV